MSKFLIISNQAFSVYNFRGALIKELVKNDFEVYASAPDYTDDLKDKVKSLGAIPIDFRLSRSKLGIFDNFLSLYDIIKILFKVKPHTVLAYSIKPVIFGIILSWIFGIEKRFGMIEGLGYVFMDDKTSKSVWRKVLKKIVIILYRLSCKLSTKTIFLNNDDINLFVSNKIINKNKVFKIDGIGVDTNYYYTTDANFSPISFVFVGRLLIEKGIRDFIESAIELNKKYPEVRFKVVGGLDLNPGSITKEELSIFKELEFIEFCGELSDIRPVVASSSVFVLPSYREGLPRSTIEAMAMQKPVITTDVPGCRETVINNINGFIIPVRDPISLASAMENFIKKPIIIDIMGKESRGIAERRFKDTVINNELVGLFK